MRSDILTFLQSKNVTFHITDDLQSTLDIADAFYCTRIQDEYDDSSESSKIDISKFALKESMLCKMKDKAIIMHPFPRRNEIDTNVDNSEKALYWKQSRNGMWIRAALILKLLKRDHMIH
jgi:aspartate carbamoyltransferase catalytic subunit